LLPRKVSLGTFAACFLLVAAPAFAAWTLTAPQDDEQIDDDANIIAEGMGPSGMQPYIVKLLNPSHETVQQFSGATSPTSPHYFSNTFTPTGSGSSPVTTGWSVELWHLGTLQSFVEIEIVDNN